MTTFYFDKEKNYSEQVQRFIAKNIYFIKPYTYILGDLSFLQEVDHLINVCTALALHWTVVVECMRRKKAAQAVYSCQQ